MYVVGISTTQDTQIIKNSYLQVSMSNFHLVKELDSIDHLYEQVPDLALRDGLSCQFGVTNEVFEVTTFSIVHHNAQIRRFFNESIFVSNDIWMI